MPHSGEPPARTLETGAHIRLSRRAGVECHSWMGASVKQSCQRGLAIMEREVWPESASGEPPRRGIGPVGVLALVVVCVCAEVVGALGTVEWLERSQDAAPSNLRANTLASVSIGSAGHFPQCPPTLRQQLHADVTDDTRDEVSHQRETSGRSAREEWSAAHDTRHDVSHRSAVWASLHRSLRLSPLMPVRSPTPTPIPVCRERHRAEVSLGSAATPAASTVVRHS